MHLILSTLYEYETHYRSNKRGWITNTIYLWQVWYVTREFQLADMTALPSAIFSPFFPSVSFSFSILFTVFFMSSHPLSFLCLPSTVFLCLPNCLLSFLWLWDDYELTERWLGDDRDMTIKLLFSEMTGNF